MTTGDIDSFIKDAKKSGSTDADIKKALQANGWRDADIDKAFLAWNQTATHAVSAMASRFKLDFQIPTEKLRTIKKHPYFKFVVAGVLVIAVVFGGYKIFRQEKVAISEFTLTASATDAAGISPDAIFVLHSTADLDESAVEKYLTVEPQVALKINKTSTNTFEITPEDKLPENRVLAIMIKAGPIADKTFSWAYQVKAPFQVTGTLPRDKSTSVPLNSGIELTLNREGIKNPNGAIEISPAAPGRIELHRNILVFVPSQELKPETIYTVTLHKGLKIEGSDDTLEEDSVFKFETGNKGYGNGNYSSFNFNKFLWEFKPDTEPAFEVYSYNAPTQNLPANAYRFDNLNDFLKAYNGSVQPEYGWSQYGRSKTFGAPDDKKIFSGTVFVENQLNANFVRIPQKLAEGYYLFDVLAGERHVQAWFQVTPLSNYLAVSGKHSLVWVRSLDGGQPAGNADISFNGRKVGKTNAEGMAQFDTPDELIYKEGDYSYNSMPSYFYTVNANGKEVAVPVEQRYGGFSKVSQPYQWWNYLSVDKTIYQPDDTLRFWGIAKQRNGSDIKGEEIVMQLTDPVFSASPENLTVYAQTKATISEFYTVTGEINFSGLRPGTYQLSIKRGSELIISQSITVEAYIKPAYRLVLTPNKNVVFAGDTINFNVKGEFFDGTPVANAQLKYRSYFDGERTGTLKLNADGQGTFSIKTSYNENENRYWPQYMSVTVMPAIAEEGEIAQSASILIFGPQMDLRSEQSMGNQVFRTKLKLKNIVLDKIQSGEAFWVSQNYLGDPVANYPVKAEVVQITYTKTQTDTGYDPINKTTYPIYRYDRNEKSIRTVNLTTDGNGEASFEQPLEKEKAFRIIFTTRDRSGRLVRTENYAYGGSSSPFNYYDAAGINLADLLRDKAGYKVGDKVALQIQDNAGNALAPGNKNFVFIKVVNGEFTFQNSDSPDYNDTFWDKDIPNASVVGVWFSGNRFYDAWPVNLSYDSNERRLQINVKQDKERYKPGDEVKLSIEVKDQNGKPKQAEVNVSGLDEAAFTLNPEEQDITNDLYRDVYSSLLTRSSHLTPLQSGAEGGGCFLPGTKITTSIGPKNIEDIRIGDYIITKSDEDSSELVSARVRRTTSHLVQGYLVINGTVRVTENHRIFVNGIWVRAGNIKVGDLLLNSQGKKVLVKSVQKHNDWLWVYNFEVEGQHTYFADGFYVHNEEKGGGESRGDFKDVVIYKTVSTGSDGRATVTFKVPDNITSWRLTTQAISKDWFAGKSIDFLPVGLPFFVETALNRTYLAGDSPLLRVRVFGTANIPDSVQYKIESDTLPFKKIERTAGKTVEFDLGQLTVGKHKLVISANAGGMKDSITREFQVLNSYFTKNSSQYYDVSSSLENIKGNDKGFAELLFTSQDRGRLYSPLAHYQWSGGIRVDQIGSRYIADILLNRYFGEDLEQNKIELRQYQTQNGGIALLPYSSDELPLSAQFADLMKGENIDISRESLKDYFYHSLNDRTTDTSRIVQALYGLAALDEPVLVSLQNIKKDGNLTLMEKAYIALALDSIGAKEEARAYYRDNLKSHLVTKKPYSYIDELKDKDDNIVLTSLLANLAGSLREPEADGMATYVRENPPKETLTNFALLGYIKKTLPQLKGGDVSFTYRTDKKNETETLEKDEVFRLNLSAEELKTLRFENINGNIGLVSFFNREVSPDEITKDRSVGITRKYFVNGRLITEFNEGDLVKVELNSSFNAGALPGLYQVTDYLPSGLRAVTKYNLLPLDNNQCFSFPSMVEDQKVTFLDWNPKSTYCPAAFYYARVVTKGKYKAEPVLIQSTKNLDSLNISAPAQVEIK